MRIAFGFRSGVLGLPGTTSRRYRQVIHDSNEARDFFVSYTGADVAWAEWIAWQLEAEGYTVVLQAWDFLPGTNFPLEMHKAASTARRTLAILSPDYLSSASAQPEWAAAFKEDPTGAARRLLTVRVRPCDPPGLLGPVVYVDLVGCGPEEARARLLTIVRDRLKPTHEPDFPLVGAPPFPTASLSSGAEAPTAGKLSAKSLVQHGRRRTAYPLDLSLAQLVDEDLVVGTRIAPQGGKLNAAELTTDDVASSLASGKSCLLLGEPGAGKSLNLYLIALRCQELGKLPICLRAAEISGIEAHLQQLLESDAAKDLVLLYDGLDEALVHWESETPPPVFRASLDAVPCLVASRTREFERSSLGTTTAAFDAVFVLRPWRPKVEFREYLDRLAAAGHFVDPELYRRVVRSADTSRLVERPLYARMLTFVGEGEDGIIKDRYALYGAYLAKLARVADDDLHRRRLPGSAWQIWERAALFSHGAEPHLPGAVSDQALEALADKSTPRQSVEVAVSHLLDVHDFLGATTYEFLHYSFYEHLLASAVHKRMTSDDSDPSITLDTLRQDLPREVRHHLLARLRVAGGDGFAERLASAYRLIPSSGFPRRERQSAANLIIYLLSRLPGEGSARLQTLVRTERDPFLRIALLWALCHLGSDAALSELSTKLRKNRRWRSMARGYVLYYYGDLARSDGPPFEDRAPFRPCSKSRQLVVAMLQERSYRKSVPVARQWVDAYTLLDILAVRETALTKREHQALSKAVLRISSSVDAEVSAILSEKWKALDLREGTGLYETLRLGLARDPRTRERASSPGHLKSRA